MVFASDALSRFSPTRHVPPIALTVAAVVPAAVVAIAEIISESALLRVISFAVVRHLHRVPDGRAGGADRPQPRVDSLGASSRSAAMGWAVNIAALVYGVARRAEPRVAARR